MKKFNITKEQFNRSRYFKNKYGRLEYVSESGKMFKTNKGKVLMFKESQVGAKEGYQYRVTVDWTWETRNAWNNSIPYRVYVGVPFDVVDSGDVEGYISDYLSDEYGPFNDFQFRRVG